MSAHVGHGIVGRPAPRAAGSGAGATGGPCFALARVKSEKSVGIPSSRNPVANAGRRSSCGA
jgi:hypothetical protein